MKVQARELKVPIRNVEGLVFKGHPENTAYEYFAGEGFTGSYCEGGAILLLIRAAALDYLHRLNPFNSRRDARTRFSEAQLTIHSEHLEQICSVIADTSIAQVEENFAEIYTDGDTKHYYPGLDNVKIRKIARALTMPKLSRTAQAIGEDPYTLRSGWPDLTLVNSDGDLVWAEVKTTDKLHRSQINTIFTMRHLLPGRLLLVHLS